MFECVPSPRRVPACGWGFAADFSLPATQKLLEEVKTDLRAKLKEVEHA